MKKRILSLVLAVLMIATLLPVSASADKSASEIKQQIIDTYATAKAQFGNKFDGYCGAYVGYQLKILGINTAVEGGNGCDQFDHYKNKSKSSGGYPITAYPASNYSLASALNAISENGSKSVYNILVGFQVGYQGNVYGHVMFIHAIIGGNVYYSDNYTINGNPEGTPIVKSISAFSSAYTNSYPQLDGVIYFGTKNSTVTITFNANGGSCSTSTKSISKGGSLGNLPTPTRTNYTFDGWYTAASGGTKISASTTFSSNTTVYAHWTINTAKVTLYNADKSVWQSTSANYGSSYTLPSTYPAKDGYYFCGWSYTDGAADYDIRPTEKLTISGAVNLYPVFVSYDKVVSGDVVYIYNVDDFDDDAYTAKEKTVDTTVEEDASYWGSWSTYTTSAVSPSSTRQVRTATLYRYYYFLCPSCGAHEPFWGTSDCGKAIPSSAWHEKWSTTPYSKSNYQKFSYTSARYYTTSLGDGQLWIFGSANLNDTAVGTIDSGSEAVVIKTGYSYRDYIKKTNTKTVSRTGYVFELTGCKHNYTAQSVAATDSEPEHVLYTCTECGDTYKEYLGNWSDWAAKLPGSVTSDSHDIETKTLYRYRDNTTTTQYGDWSTSKTTTSKPTESNTLRITATKTFYNYYHY